MNDDATQVTNTAEARRRLQPGCWLGSYRIVRLLGEGGMGCVYEAEHVELKVRRAIKVFSTESEHVDFLCKRFIAEGRMLADLHHPRIVRVYDFAFDETTGAPYFAMDFIVSPTGSPRTLDDFCREGADESRIAGWLRDICEGLAYIHSKGVVHRDVSLDNILIDSTGRAVIGDFGIAKIVGEEYRRRMEITATMAVFDSEKLRMGKELYMAPELTNGGEATPASDAYAVGVLLFRMLTGSWYTPETRVGDALAEKNPAWAAAVSALCQADVEARGSVEDFVGFTLRPAKSPVWKIVALAFAGAAVVAAIAFAYARYVELSALATGGEEHRQYVAEQKKLADDGDIDACKYLARMYMYGDDYIRPSPKLCFHYSQLSADNEDEVGQRLLAMCYENGFGTPKDLYAAAKYMLMAAENMDTQAMYEYGRYCEFGVGISPDVEAAIDWYERAADDGNVKAEERLAQLKARRARESGSNVNLR